MKKSVAVMAISAGLFLAGCEAPTANGTNAGTEQLRSVLTPSMRRAGLSEECIQSLSPSALASVKSAANAGPRPRVTAGNVGLGNPRRREEGRIQAIARRECPDF